MASWTNHFIPIVILATGIYFYFFTVTPGPTVQTLNGKVRGIVSKSRGGREYYSFLGIPYAQPPQNELRFEDPVPVSNWEGVLKADHLAAECLQLEVLVLVNVVGHEDCLTLNIFTPNVDPNKKLPVLVYIHGGLFMGGSSKIYRGAYILDEEVILVTLNYRVAALGFLTTGDGLIRGNQGLKDQSMAFRWIKNNIESFGGDSSKITLFGESAGGAAVHYHLLSPQSKGLFSKAISMSGTAIRRYESTSDKFGQVKHFGSKFGCNFETSAEIVACLKKVDGHLIVEGHRDASEAIPSGEFSHYDLFAPSVEVIDDSQAFLAQNPKEMLEMGNLTRIPWATGVVQMEGLLYVSRIVREPGAVKRLNENWLQVLPLLLKYDPKEVALTRKIKEFYFGKVENLDIENNIHKISDMFSDRLFIHPTFVAAKLQAKYTNVYLYYLTYEPKASAYNLVSSITPNGKIPPQVEYVYSLLKRWVQKNIFGINVPTYGPSHGDELSLLFNMHFLVYIGDESHQDYQFSKDLVTLFCDFAKNEKAVHFNGHHWKPVTQKDSHLKYLEINVNGVFKTNPENEELARRLKFWDTLNLPFS